MPQPLPRHLVIPLHGWVGDRRDQGPEPADGPLEARDPILHPAAAEAVKEAAPPVAPEIGFWNNVPVRREEADLRPNPLTWAIMKARRDRMKAYLPIIEVTTMLMLTALGVLIEHFALMIFGDWK